MISQETLDRAIALLRAAEIHAIAKRYRRVEISLAIEMLSGTSTLGNPRLTKEKP